MSDLLLYIFSGLIKNLIFYHFQCNCEKLIESNLNIWGCCGLMVMASDCGLGVWGSIPGRDKSLTPGFVFKQSSNMMVTSVRVDGCEDISHEQKSLI